MAISGNDLYACDARISICDDALFRQNGNLISITGSRCDDTLTPLEKEARDYGLGYIEMDGDVGVIGNGAGLNF